MKVEREWRKPNFQPNITTGPIVLKLKVTIESNDPEMADKMSVLIGNGVKDLEDWTQV